MAKTVFCFSQFSVKGDSKNHKLLFFQTHTDIKRQLQLHYVVKGANREVTGDIQVITLKYLYFCRCITMVRWCRAWTTKNHHLMKNKDRSSKYAFCKFPSQEKEAERREPWARACSRKEQNTQKPWAPKHEAKYVNVCSAKFIK